MRKTTLLAAMVTALSLGQAYAAGEGSAVGVDPDAVARRGSTDRVLVVGADVSVGERIVTGPTGRVQIVFQDSTRLVVGPGSSLQIESYLLKGNQADKFAVNALAGTFRFISGNSRKSSHSVTTPTATIAVRGTKFDVTVAPNATQVMLYEGGVQLCKGGQCVELTDRCDFAAADANGSALISWDDNKRGNLVRNFPLANVQTPLLQPFRVAGAQACLTPNAAPANTYSGNEPGGAVQTQPTTGMTTGNSTTNTEISDNGTPSTGFKE